VAISPLSQQPVNLQINTDPTQQTNQTTGSGAIGQNGPTPPIDGNGQAAPSTPVYAAMMASLLAIMPQMSDDQQEVVLAMVTDKMKDMEAKSDKDQISVDSDKKKAALAEKEGKLHEASKKIEKAIWDRDHQSIWDKIKSIFMAIASALMVVIGALLAPFTAGASTVLIVAGIVCLAASVVMAVNDITMAATGLGIAGNLDKLVHPNDPSSWAKADMGFTIAVMIVGLAASIPNMLDGAGEIEFAAIGARLGDLLGKTAETAARGEKMAEMIAEALDVSTKTITDAVKFTKVADSALQVTAAVGDATMSVVSGVYQYDATNENADAKKLQGEAKAKQALMQQLDDFIDLALSHLMAASNRWNDMLDGITDAMKDKQDTLQHAKLTA